jgi:lysozyme
MPYLDSVGKLTVGYGHNLEDTPITKQAAECIMIEDLKAEEALLTRLLPIFHSIQGPRREALLNMAFNLGSHGLIKFRRMWAAIGRHDWESASLEAADSKWAKQVGRRATELVEQIRTGEYNTLAR